MIRVANVTEKNIRPTPPFMIVAAASASTDVLPDIGGTNYGNIEVCGRYVFNNSGSAAYYAFGQDCSPVDYHGVLANQQQLDCSNHGARVSVFSVAGGTFVGTELRRLDLVEQQNIGNFAHAL